MKIFGLTGGIGSGKSVVAELLGILGVPVYDSDARSKELCQTDKDLKKDLIKLFGPEIFDQDILNRQALADRIFGNEKALNAANALIHPAVKRDFMNWVQEHQHFPVLVMESALIFEAGLASIFDQVICVTAPEAIRIERACKRSGLSQEAVKARIDNQLSESKRVALSDMVIVNDDIQAMIPQVKKIFCSSIKEHIFK
ncbi:MAG: dephospho-CoA kinase [Bacteroidales bacterium]|nr:dephospho-CoA kinase [Bacteroidales bacterium]MDD4712397.1 dephospho-CoA kinase [Bacteroidales bacterium]